MEASAFKMSLSTQKAKELNEEYPSLFIQHTLSIVYDTNSLWWYFYVNAIVLLYQYIIDS